MASDAERAHCICVGSGIDQPAIVDREIVYLFARRGQRQQERGTEKTKKGHRCYATPCSAGICARASKLRAAWPMRQTMHGERAIRQLLLFGKLAVWLSIAALVYGWAHRHGLPDRAVLNGWQLVLCCGVFATLCHESGHVVAGWAAGMELTGVNLGPLLASKVQRRWKLQLSLHGLLAGTAHVRSHPVKGSNLRSRVMLTVLGGPVASALTCATASALLASMPGTAYQLWWKVPAMLAAIAATDTLLNLIPHPAALGASDGASLLRLIKGCQLHSEAFVRAE